MVDSTLRNRPICCKRNRSRLSFANLACCCSRNWQNTAAPSKRRRECSFSLRRDLGMLESSIRAGGKLLLFGNGGSAADAQHIAAELMIRYKADRVAISAVALTTDTSTLTACGNDLGFDALFERQIEGLGRVGDVAVGISTSGTSANVLRGLRRAKMMGLRTAGLSGGTGGEMRPVCDALIVVPHR